MDIKLFILLFALIPLFAKAYYWHTHFVNQTGYNLKFSFNGNYHCMKYPGPASFKVHAHQTKGIKYNDNGDVTYNCSQRAKNVSYKVEDVLTKKHLADIKLEHFLGQKTPSSFMTRAWRSVLKVTFISPEVHIDAYCKKDSGNHIKCLWKNILSQYIDYIVICKKNGKKACPRPF